MATTFPTTLQDLDATRGTALQPLNNPSHVTHHTKEDDTAEALQAKVGVDSSAVATSLDYLLKNTASTDPGHKHTAANGASDKTFPSGTIVGSTDTQTLTNKTLTTPVVASLYQDAAKTLLVTMPAATDTLVGKATTDTLTNKTMIATTNVVEEISTIADSATPTPTGGSLRNLFTVTALAQAATFAAPSGTPANGNKLIVRILDNGTARALSWNAIYVVIGTTLPTTTVLSKYTYVGCIYNSASSKWEVLAVNTQA